KELELKTKEKDKTINRQSEQIRTCQLKVDTLVHKHNELIQNVLYRPANETRHNEDEEEEEEENEEINRLNVARFQLLLQHEEEKQEHVMSMKRFNANELTRTCEDMVDNIFLYFALPMLQNNVDYLLVNEHNKTIKLKNNECNHFKFGIYLVGRDLKLTVDCNKLKNEHELGILKIRTSHLWIKHSTSSIDCSQLGYPSDFGPGAGAQPSSTFIWSRELHGGGAGYGTIGGESDVSKGHGNGGFIYGEETLLTSIFCGSGGGSGMDHSASLCKGGFGGGSIQLVIEQHFVNNGSLLANGEFGFAGLGGGGSGGSILIDLCSHYTKHQHVLGNIRCDGGHPEGGSGRIAIYGTRVSAEDTKKISPKPFFKLDKNDDTKTTGLFSFW
ncbi:hypothetical protein RFI_11660, partial [Reticulomyxa filosa]